MCKACLLIHDATYSLFRVVRKMKIRKTGYARKCFVNKGIQCAMVLIVKMPPTPVLTVPTEMDIITFPAALIQFLWNPCALPLLV